MVISLYVLRRTINLNWSGKVVGFSLMLMVAYMLGLWQASAQDLRETQDSAQHKQDGGIRSVQLWYHHGFVFAHQPEIEHLNNMPSRGVQLDVAPGFMLGRKWWQAYQYGSCGISLLLNQNGPDRTLGTSIGIGPYLETYLWRGQRSSLQIRGTTGITWNSAPFHLYDNPLNPAISSRFSALLQGGLFYEYGLTDHWAIRAGTLVTHYSNGSFEMPNYGLNMPHVSMGVSYRTEATRRYDRDPSQDPDWAKETSIWVVGQAGLAESLPVNGPKFGTFTLSAVAERRVALKSSLTLGADFMANPSLARWVRFQPGWAGASTDAAGITLGHNLHMGRTILHTQGGLYVYKPFPLYPILYQRVGLSYGLHKRWRAGIMLKLHNFSAETVEAAVQARLY